MEQPKFKAKIDKQLWYLNRKERKILNSELSGFNAEMFKAQYRSQNQFVISFLSRHIFNSKPKSQLHLVITLLGLIFLNTIIIGFFITGLLLSLASIKYLISPTNSLQLQHVFLILIASGCMIITTLLLVKPVNGFLTKRLIDYKLNRLT
ncbi:hypothetical protein BUZ56_09870 [Staphylococcus hyicus]|uniref:hypothetical protein n=2 Tax=Staphylococcus hyicus TaxID=1284 RepID=UPI000D1E67C5|nr:hypothetical protein [Staphylococcus hyicus]MCQ9299626.1 hypothetical protein [Staphylococcus hyicus]MDP4448222.1 hypothetical protein [Staphylococcus hyicus]MDP4459922.1 hypothetical protein [Staphylococcus hyicus]MDP4468577.1 hypothetical protein [Staphylococcus hyicus]PTJ71998.1 hypothetical protein BUZ58_05535 [Staphylococcus hyicus]